MVVHFLRKELEQEKRKDYLDIRLRRMVRSYLEKKNSHSPWTKLGLLGDPQQTLLVRILSGIALLICLTMFTYQTCDRIMLYFKYPVTTDVFVTKMMHQAFPEITVCYQATEGTYRILDEYRVGKKCHTLPIRNILQLTVNQTMHKLWEIMNTSSGLISAKEFGKDVLHNMNYSDVLLPYGTCTTFRTKSITSSDTATGMIELTFKYTNNTCTYKTGTMVYIHDVGEPPVFRHEHELRVGMKNEIGITMRKFSFINRSMSPCISDIEYQNCRYECFVKYSLNKTTCRFPFQPTAVKLPDCITGQATLKTWNNIQNYLIGRMPKDSICVCPRKCRHDTFSEKINPIEVITNQSVYIVKFGDSIETEIQERYIYDVIKLLSDLGGNSGLFIGMSVLSVLTVFTPMRQKKSNVELFSSDPLYAIVLKTIYRFKKHAELKARGRLHKFRSDSLPLSRKLLVLICLCVFVLAVFNRTTLFLQCPVRNIIQVSFNATFEPPTITICAGQPTVENLQKEFARRKNVSDFCEVNIWDLFILPTVNASILWNLNGLGKIKPYQWKVYKAVNLHDGTCFDFYESNKVPADSFYWLISHNKPLCGTNYQKVYVKPPTGYYDYYHYSYIIEGNKQQITYSIKEIKIDETLHACTSEKYHEYCKDSCRKKKLLQRISCRLPYMFSSTLPLCNTSGSVKHAHLSYQEMLLPGNVDDCDCLPPCVKRFYETSETAAPKDDLTLSFGSSHNIVETYSTRPAYPIEALLCDIGSWLGSTLGLCVFSFMDRLLTVQIFRRWCCF